MLINSSVVFSLDELETMKHPKILDGTGTLGYAGFPVINRDNYALGTLCMLNKEPKSLETTKVKLIEKITANIGLLLDLRIEQKRITAEKILDAVSSFLKFDAKMTVRDLQSFMALISDLKIEGGDSKRLFQFGLCERNGKKTELSEKGRALLAEMKLRVKPMKKLKLDGIQAESLIDKMFSELN